MAGGLLGVAGTRPSAELLAGLLDRNIVSRSALLPFGVNPQGGMEFPVMPQALVDLGSSLMLPGDALKGHYPSRRDAAKMAADIVGGGGFLSGMTRPVSGALGMNMWHGGPHKWAPEPDFPHGRPRMDKMGTGEGAQAYGHGFYSAESRGVADDYFTKLSQKKFDHLTDAEQELVPSWVVRKIKQGDPESGVNEAILEFTSRKQQDMAELARPNPVQPHLIEGRIKQHGARIAALEKLETGKNFNVTETGALYKLDLPDADVAKYLDWDAPLSQQPEILAKFKLDEQGRMILPNGERVLPEKLRGESLYRAIGEGTLEGPVGASEALRKAGIPGLKYYDQMSRGQRNNQFQVSGGKQPMAFDSRAAAAAHVKANGGKVTDTGQGTRNYVTWDQDVLDRAKILERNNEILANQLKDKGLLMGGNPVAAPLLMPSNTDPLSDPQRAAEFIRSGGA